MPNIKKTYLETVTFLKETLRVSKLSGCYIESDRHPYENLVKPFVFSRSSLERISTDYLLFEDKLPQHVSIVLLPEHIVSAVGINWISIAALLDYIPKQSIVLCLPYVDYSDLDIAELTDYFKSFGADIIYAPSVDDNANTMCDVTNGKLAFLNAEEKRKQIVKYYQKTNPALPPGRKEKDEPKDIMFYGQLPDGFIKDYLEDKKKQITYDVIQQKVHQASSRLFSNRIRSDTLSILDFTEMISLGNYHLPDDLETWKPEYEQSDRIDCILNTSTILQEHVSEGQKEGENAIKTIDDYNTLWNSAAGTYGLEVSNVEMCSNNINNIRDMAAFIGVDMMIEAYANGISVENILA